MWLLNRSYREHDNCGKDKDHKGQTKSAFNVAKIADKERARGCRLRSRTSSDWSNVYGERRRGDRFTPRNSHQEQLDLQR
jgi:hypothetical protein